MAHSLPEELQGKAVFRIAVLSIVLALAARPSATLLCSAWCDGTSAPRPGDTSCHHNAARPSVSATVAADDACDSLILDGSAFIRENTERLASPAPRHDADLLPRHQLPRLTRADYPALAGLGAWAFENRPSLTALRI